MTKQTVLITGISTGLDRTTAKLFATRGWNVIATMCRPGPNVELARLDVQDRSSITRQSRQESRASAVLTS